MPNADFPGVNIAVILPCYNEAISIPAVVADFTSALPGAVIHVYDNNSTDNTAEAAAAAGAVVRQEFMQGKGHVIRRMFADVDADVYVMADGDDTYDASAAPRLVQALLDDRLDMVVGKRITDIQGAYRPGHRFGNLVLTGLAAWIFGNRCSDMLSGYRVFSRRFVKTFPALSKGFETETEMTIHALEMMMPLSEIETAYKDRPTGSTSKLNTYKDGARILQTIVLLIKEERPLFFFSTVGTILALASLILAAPLFATYLESGLVPRFPTAILSTGLILTSVVSFAAGLILDSVSRGRKEMKRLAYLRYPAPDFKPDRS